MKINDRIYGGFEINEQVLIDLINSKAMQRLKGISQFGMPDEFYHKNGFSRYAHCVGVMLLLRKLGASLQEQVAGLLHDVSHTAFSHVIDWVIGDPEKENYQDEVFLQFIEKSEIPSILEKHGYDYKKICDVESFSLLENNAPDICADRIDYSLREIADFESMENFKLILDSLTTFNGNIVFNSGNAAELFAFGYMKCNKEHWAAVESKSRYYMSMCFSITPAFRLESTLSTRNLFTTTNFCAENSRLEEFSCIQKTSANQTPHFSVEWHIVFLILSNILRIALEKKIINKEDFWKTDNEVINKLIHSNDKEILDGLALLRVGFEVKESNGKNSFVLRKKFRYVDPYFIEEDNLERVSKYSEIYRKALDDEKKESQIVKSFEVLQNAS